MGAAAATAAAGWAVTATRLHARTRQLHRAHRDPVTGLLTRAAWEPAARAALRQHGSTLGLLDLDGFKPINDTHGHKTGDHVLRTVATRLKTELGHVAVVGRLGGDELAFVTHELCPGQIDDLLAALTALIPITSVTGPKELRVGVSLGISALGCAAELPDALLAADLAMYEAKTRRSGWQLHAPNSGAGTPSPAICPHPRAAPRAPTRGPGGEVTMTENWEHRAACAGTMLELWFGPEDYEEPVDQSRWRHRRASEFCATCPVWTECVAEELVRPLSEQHGIRGGFTPRGRERLLSRWRAAGLVPEHGPPDDVDLVRRLLTESDLLPAARDRPGS